MMPSPYLKFAVSLLNYFVAVHEGSIKTAPATCSDIMLVKQCYPGGALTDKAPLGHAKCEAVSAYVTSLSLREYNDYLVRHVKLYVTSRVLVAVVLQTGEIMAAPGRPIQYLWLYLSGIST
jgi:hypothetical protein